MSFLSMIASGEGAVSNVLDSTVITAIINAVKEFIGILTTPPLGIFITIGILGTVVALVASIVHLVKRG